MDWVGVWEGIRPFSTGMGMTCVGVSTREWWKRRSMGPTNANSLKSCMRRKKKKINIKYEICVYIFNMKIRKRKRKQKQEEKNQVSSVLAGLNFAVFWGIYMCS